MSATSAPRSTVLPTGRASSSIAGQPAGNPPPGNTKGDQPVTERPRPAADEGAVSGGSVQAHDPSAVLGLTPDVQGNAAPVVATSSAAAEAEQGDGPAAASASSSAVSDATSDTNAVSVVVGPDGAAAACPFGVVVIGPRSAAAASQIGVVAVGPNGASAACNAANGTRVAVDGAAAPATETATQASS